MNIVGAGGGQDHRLLADGQGDVHRYIPVPVLYAACHYFYPSCGSLMRILKDGDIDLNPAT